MAEKKIKLAIINRSFWPVYPVIGEALLRFAESKASDYSVSVIMQDHAGIKVRLSEENRGDGVKFYPVKAWTTSSSGVSSRALDAVFFMLWVCLTLLWVRPKKIYVSTDPPVLVPFIVFMYCKLFGAKYIYHLQDIHPEAANVVIPVRKEIFKILIWMDSVVMRNAERLITITEEMAEHIRFRSGTGVPIEVLDNPAVSFDGIAVRKDRIAGFSFCGNAGRLQRVPLLINAIKSYIESGGNLHFSFAGSGVYSEDLKRLSVEYSQVKYFGLVSSRDAAQLSADYEWALLPIEDEVTRYAFPSKSSSYVLAGAKILAICGEGTSVAKWVKENHLGCAVQPSVEALVGAFFKIESSNLSYPFLDVEHAGLKERLDFDYFVQKLSAIVLRGRDES